jgi:hypothetical protein
MKLPSDEEALLFGLTSFGAIIIALAVIALLRN